MDDRSERLAENEAVFRAGNEAIRTNSASEKEKRPYLCECGLATCFEHVILSGEEYEAVRAHSARSSSVRVEDLTAVEVVVQESSRYSIVEKRGDEARIVERTDPRAE